MNIIQEIQISKRDIGELRLRKNKGIKDIFTSVENLIPSLLNIGGDLI